MPKKTPIEDIDPEYLAKALSSSTHVIDLSCNIKEILQWYLAGLVLHQMYETFIMSREGYSATSMNILFLAGLMLILAIAEKLMSKSQKEMYTQVIGESRRNDLAKVNLGRVKNILRTKTETVANKNYPNYESFYMGAKLALLAFPFFAFVKPDQISTALSIGYLIAVAGAYAKAKIKDLRCDEQKKALELLAAIENEFDQTD